MKGKLKNRLVLALTKTDRVRTFPWAYEQVFHVDRLESSGSACKPVRT